MPDHSSKKRRFKRDNVLLSASLDFPDRSQPVKLRNLSEEGALVEGAEEIERDSELLFRRNGIQVAARVVWVRDGFAGLEFEQKLDRKVVLRNMPSAAPRIEAPPRLFKRPGLTNHHVSPEEREWIDKWSSSSGS